MKLSIIKLPKWRISIRWKIVALIAGALAVSLVSYLYIGTSLVIQDKTSYIYDYNLSQVKAASDAIESRIQKITETSRIIGSSISQKLPAGNHAALQRMFDQHGAPVGISGLLYLRIVGDQHFSLEQRFGEGAKDLDSALAQMGWTPEIYKKQETLVGLSNKGRIPVGGLTTDSDGNPLAFFALFTFDAKLLDGISKDFTIRLMDSLGKPILSRADGQGLKFDASATEKLDQFLLQGNFTSGAKDWKINSKDYIVGYQRIAYKQLVVTGFISKDQAFSGAKLLIYRSLALGASILLLALGVAILFSRSLTGRIRQMWNVTSKVGNGDFSSRVEIKGSSDDEISDLALSFNSMADKITELMSTTADKARMDKELETAQAVQNAFFPSKPFDHEMVKLRGAFTPASECGGDWWHYVQVGHHLIVVIGDVTGHGVSSALVTAAVHGAFSVIMRGADNMAKRLDDENYASSVVVNIMKCLNTAVLSAANNSSSMTFMASTINLQTGMMITANASHCLPYIYRKPTTPGKSATAGFKTLVGAANTALGYGPEIDITAINFQLEPGDMIFWYTDGLFDQRVDNGDKLSKTAFLRDLGSKVDNHGSDASTVCEMVMSEVLTFFGDKPENRPDDITLIVGIIPKEGQFVAKPKAA